MKVRTFFFFSISVLGLTEHKRSLFPSKLQEIHKPSKTKICIRRLTSETRCRALLYYYTQSNKVWQRLHGQSLAESWLLRETNQMVYVEGTGQTYDLK